ncbi:uncharacterized protein [Zea mays]|uniref:uncharacterized protein n=1 Tax=Zea mays TaxID=4577 RepID=UPI0009AAB2BA|nr:uncharacterized protein LOC103633325 [Zea mays]|eukprot:XP_020396599.1 uncharacterized protein LOC103633325 [Zea mays]
MSCLWYADISFNICKLFVDLMTGPVMSSPPCPSSLPLDALGGNNVNEDNDKVQDKSRLDWESMVLCDFWEEEGSRDVVSEMQMFSQLGFNEGENAQDNTRDEAVLGGTSNLDQSEPINFGDNTIDQTFEDYLPNEKRVMYDKMNPSMQPGSLFPNMKEFRIAMRQYAIKHEFELGIDVTSTTRYVGYCKGGDCPWRIYAREEKKGLPTIVVAVLHDSHTCTSSGRRKTTTPSCGWVAFHALPLLMKKPNMGAKELQDTLQGVHNVTIGYDTVWKGNEKALEELFGSWEESFKLLFSWREAVLAKEPDSIVEIDVVLEDEKYYFNRFFCALGPCISGFRDGCRPYLSVDSTNGRWDGQLASVTAVDGHNWMYPLAFGFFQSETVDSWIWFMSQLKKAVGELEVLAICSDLQH